MRTRTDPAIIRRGLDIADQHSPYRAAKEIGVHHKTIYRWIARRDREGASWPTQADMDAWRADVEATQDRRERDAALARTYRKRRYLNRGPLQVPAIGTIRRLRALYALGWTCVQLGDRLGVSKARVAAILNARSEKVLPETAANVAQLYRELSMVTPLDPPALKRGDSPIHERTRRYAKRRGWAPPMAWDDIDDPNAEPQGVGVDRMKRTAEETVAEVEHLLKFDPHATSENLAWRLGYRDRSGVQQALDRAGRQDLLDRLARNAELAGHGVTRRSA